MIFLISEKIDDKKVAVHTFVYETFYINDYISKANFFFKCVKINLFLLHLAFIQKWLLMFKKSLDPYTLNYNILTTFLKSSIEKQTFVLV